MENANNFAGGLTGTIVMAVGSSMSINQVQAIISIIVTVLGFMITVATTIIIPIWKKIRDAKKDGKITPEEAEDIVNTLKDGLDNAQHNNNKGEDK